MYHESYFSYRWQFQTEARDIGFALFFKTGEGYQKAGEMEEVTQGQRVNSHMVPEDGSFTCSKSGTCEY